ncbi:MAG: T9SS type A sorting domain-containing protein, partial [candidate division WOR-3 bacterium]
RKPQSAIFEPLRYRGDNEIRILPNPCHKILWIYTTNFLSNLRLRLWDVTGREIKILQIKGPVTKFDLSDLPDGVYFIAIDFSPKILQKFVYRH